MTDCNCTVVLFGKKRKKQIPRLGITAVDVKSQDATKFALRQLDLNSYGQQGSHIFGAFQRKLDKCP